MFASSLLSFGLLLAPLANAMVYDITVGGSDGKLEFTPEAIGAQPGDQVVFHFQQKNHTVTQSSFADPCGKMEGGINSGFMPVPANQTDHFPTYTVTVNDTQPIWMYCAQAAKTPQSHCGQGMVFAINCGPDGAPNSFTNFKNSALEVGKQLQAAAAPPADASSAPAYGGYGGYGAPPAATTTEAAAPSGTAPAGAVTTHTVIVGGNGTLTFNPPEVQAVPNDVVVFQFTSKNHTITQSSFASPCAALSSSSTSGQAGFDSGFMPVPTDSTSFPTFSITVNDTTPIWAYCKQANHCQQGMVFAINANDSSDKSYSAFTAAAKSGGGATAPAGSGSAAPAGTTGAAAGAAGAASGSSRTTVSAGMVLGLVGAVFAFIL